MIFKSIILGLCLMASAKRELGFELQNLNGVGSTWNQFQCKQGNSAPQISTFLEVAYYNDLSIGNPPQKFSVLWNTGSTNIWVPAKPCRNIFCALHNKYDSTKSSTYERNGANFSMHDFRGDLWGYLSTDTLRIGQYNIQEQTFAEIVHSGGDALSAAVFDGMVGLGKSISNSEVQPLLDNMKRQGLIEKRIFSLHYNLQHENGDIAFGPPDTKYYKGDITYVPVEDENKWVISINNITIGCKKLCKNGCLASIDTGYSVIVGPANDVAAINKIIGGSPIGGGEYLVPCEKIDRLPAVQFVIGKTTFELKGNDYVIRLNEAEGSVCLSGFKGIDIPPESRVKWTIGDVLLKKVYVVFDMEDNKVGFAQPT